MTTEVVLRVPQRRSECAAWLQGQPPSVVADYLEASERYYASIAEVVLKKEGESAALRMLREENERMRGELQDGESKRIADAREVRSQLESQHKMELQECKALVHSFNEHALDELRCQVEALRASLAEQRRHEEHRIGEAVRDVEKKLSAKTEDNEKERRLWEERLDKVQHEKMKMSAEYAEKLEQFVRPFAGTPKEIGDIGETMVEDFHRTLELGTLTNVSRCRAAGYADHTWSYNGAQTLVEEKNKKDLEVEKDYGKFRNDVRVAGASGRINMAMFLSLRCRVHGKPNFSMELISGIPTLWASRDPTEDVSAELMVKTAFRVMAEVWPLIRNDVGDVDGGDGATTLRRVAQFLNSATTSHEATQRIIRGLEATGQKLLRQITSLKKQNDSLITDIQDLKMCDARLDWEDAEGVQDEHMEDVSPELWESSHGRQLEEALDAYRNAHQGRYPKTMQQLDLDAETTQELSRLRNVLQEATARLKAKNLRARSVKRKAAPEEDN